MGIINNHDWNALKDQFQNASPFPSICIDNFLDPEFARQLTASYPSFEEAQQKGLEFKTVNERKKIQITDPAYFPDPVEALHQALKSPAFLQGMQTLSGIDELAFDPEFNGGGMHMTDVSGILDVHVDFNYSENLALYRRLNILIYLNEDWQEDWGGRVELWDKDVKHCEHSFAPVLNRCLIFATSDHSFHGVSKVAAPDGVVRKSFAIYLYNKEPAASEYSAQHSTIFKARPDEKRKKYYHMPLEATSRKVNEQLQRGSRLVKRLLGQ
ncbi:2OG-Fe(II) oxygenase [bacterium]|nr:2OG-Fe(II) oxygenase [bacterium]